MKAKQKMYKGKEALLIRGLCAKGLFSKGKTGKPSVLELHFSLHKTHRISLLLTRSNAYNNSNSSWWNNEKQEHEHTRRRVSRAIPAKSSAARRLLCDEELERLRWRRRWSRCFRRDRRDPPLEDSEAAAAADSSFELSCPIFSSLAFALAHRESQIVIACSNFYIMYPDILIPYSEKWQWCWIENLKKDFYDFLSYSQKELEKRKGTVRIKERRRTSFPISEQN